jgi:OOP family OmpA-OmpF porin
MMRATFVTVALTILPTAAPAEAPRKEGPYIALTPPSPHRVYFDSARWDLSATALNTLQDAVLRCRQNSVFPIVANVKAVGHADRSEPDVVALSLRRAEAVKDALVHQGVAAADIEAVASSTPQTTTNDDARYNRRVDVVFQCVAPR